MAQKLCLRCGFPCRKRDVCWYCYQRLQKQVKPDTHNQLVLVVDSVPFLVDKTVRQKPSA